jgi:hypothetical protein
MWAWALAFTVAIIVFILTLVISILMVFRYGMSDNQTLPPSRAYQRTFTVGTLIALAIAALPWLLQNTQGNDPQSPVQGNRPQR